MARIAPIKSATTAAGNYGTNGGSVAAQSNWAANFSADIPAILSAAAAAVGTWQTNVSLPQSATNFVNGLNAAKQSAPAIATKVNTVGKASFTAGVKAAALPTGNYSAFSAKFQPSVAAEVQQLNMTNPRGDAAANTARMVAYNAWALMQKGNFRVK